MWLDVVAIGLGFGCLAVVVGFGIATGVELALYTIGKLRKLFNKRKAN